jgi:SSS family solute:Na+ symporter
MKTLDYLLLSVYLLLMLVLGLVAMRRTKTQNDYFLGGRSFGKLLQTFAAFGAGTGAHEPVTVGRAVWFSGLSGVWIAMQWLFVTPIYWITAVWYRRMRHLTLADWFVERYESRALGVAYTLYALAFYMAFLSIMLTAIAKFAVPLLGVETLGGWQVDQVVVPLLAVTVILYGVLGGLTAAYWTDLVQGLLIIVLSVLLIPFGLWALVREKGQPGQTDLMDGFAILHQEIPADYFSLFSGPSSGEFSLLYIVSFSLLSLVGIVVHPHFIATGGGSAKTELEARIGLVLGNFLKRLCTVGWALTGLIALALLAGNPEIAADPDRAWGVAAREILGPLNLGLVGLMFACLLAAMMSSADTYMLVTSALVVRNVYAAYIQPRATEERYVAVGRVTGVVLVIGATLVALRYSNVLEQFRLALEIPILFAAPFWLGLYWRRVNTWAVWLTIAFSLTLFFILPVWLPTWVPSLRSNPHFLQTTVLETTTTVRPATRADVARFEAWQAAKTAIDRMEDPAQQAQRRKDLGPAPPATALGQPVQVVTRLGGRSIYWQGGVQPSAAGSAELITMEQTQTPEQNIVRQQWQGALVGQGHFNLDFIIYRWLGIDLTSADKATLEALRLPTRLLLPFVVLMALSLVTPRNHPAVLDRYYAKMKTPVLSDEQCDREELRRSYENPRRFEHLKLFPGSEWEMLRPSRFDVVGVVASIAICGAIIGLLVWIAGIGSVLR